MKENTTLPLLAIDIGSSSVKAMVAERVDNDTLCVLGYEESKRVIDVQQGVVLKPSYVSMYIKEMVEKLTQKLRLDKGFQNVFVCLGGKKMEIKNISTKREFTKPTVIRQALLDEMDKEVIKNLENNLKNPSPVAVLGVYPSKYIIDDREQTYPPTKKQMCNSIIRVMYNVFVGGRDLKYKIQESIQQANLEIESFFARPDALFTVLANEDKEDGCAILDMGAQTTTLTVFKNDEFTYTKTFLQGGDDITKEFMKYDIPFATAESLKMQYASCKMQKKVTYQVPTNKENQVVRISSDELNDITRSKIDDLFDSIFSEASQPLEDIKKIYVTGGGALLNGLIDYVDQKTDIKILRGSHACWLDAARSQDKYCLPKYASLIGTLAIAFDYHKEHQTESKKKFGGKVMNFLDELFEST